MQIILFSYFRYQNQNKRLSTANKRTTKRVRRSNRASMSYSPQIRAQQTPEAEGERSQRSTPPTTQGSPSIDSIDRTLASTPFYSATASPVKNAAPQLMASFGAQQPAMSTDAEIEAAMESLTQRFGQAALNDDVDANELLADIGLDLILTDPALKIGDHNRSVPSTPVRGQPHSEYLDIKDPGLVQEEELAGFYTAFNRLKIQSPVLPSQPPRTLVILSPLSYEHVFSRSWVSKLYKSSIVERPQRLMACSIGVGAAIAHAPEKLEIRASLRKPDLRKSSHVSKVHGVKWAPRLYDLCSQSKEKLANKEVEVPDEWHSGDIYLTPGTINALEGVVGAVEEAVDALLSDEPGTQPFDRAFVSVRPPGHHSHTCAPSGFCLINNVHIAIQYAAAKYGVTHAVILDFDLHHGDGSQDICWKLAGFDEADDVDRGSEKALSKIGYFSLHDINSFPTETGYATAENIKNASVCLMAHNMCVWNVHLEKYTTEADFMKLYQSKYSVLFDKAREYLTRCQADHYAEQQAIIQAQRGRGRSKLGGSSPPELAPFKPLILLSAGFDASENENVNMRRHGVHVPTSFYHRFTQDSVALARDFSNNKLISLLEGGYSDGALSTGIFSHLLGLTGCDLPAARNNAEVTKKFEQGCKLKWDVSSITKRRRSSVLPKEELLGDEDLEWLAAGVSLGRLMWPLDIQHAAIAASTKPPPTPQKERYLDARTSSGGRVLRNRSQLPGR